MHWRKRCPPVSNSRRRRPARHRRRHPPQWPAPRRTGPTPPIQPSFLIVVSCPRSYCRLRLRLLRLLRSIQRPIGRRDQPLHSTTVDVGRRARDTGVTHIAVFHRPSDFAVMASAAEFTVDDLGHGDLVAAGLELEAEGGVAYFATESNTMEPVRKHYRPHARRIRVIINDYIGILCFGGAHGQQREPGQRSQNGKSPYDATGGFVGHHARSPRLIGLIINNRPPTW